MLSTIISMFSNFIHLILGISTPQNFPPPLSSERESELFHLAEKGDAQARSELIVHNLRLVSHIVRKYYSSSKSQEDLVSIGTIGLIKAVDSFRTANGAKFTTYAAKCIQNEILMHFRAQKKLSSEVSLNDVIDMDKDGNPLTYIDVIGCDESLTADVERNICSARAMRLVETILTPREKKNNNASVRIRKQQTNDPKRNRPKARHIALICKQNRKKRAGKIKRKAVSFRQTP